MSEEHLDNLSKREDVEIHGKEPRRKDRANWKVHVIENEVERPMDVTSKDVSPLPAGHQVVLPFSKELRPIGQAGGLLSSVLGSMACDFTFFSISVRSWKQMTTNKEREFNHQIK
ncbi:hypothetical protein PIB30_058315, partial [Stylosanthes scabra]|nr:hypothetical protein [Stylosanthes scabra]